MGIKPSFDEIAVPTHGTRSDVLLVRPRGATAFALRCIGNQSEAAGLVQNFEFAQSRGLPTPRLLYSEVTRSHHRRHGFSVLVEELIGGWHRDAEQAQPNELEELGEALARLHGVESDRWGSIGNLRSRSFFNAGIKTKFENRLASIAKFDPEFQKSWQTKILQFVKSYRNQWDGGPPFALTHDKINLGNVIFTAEAGAYFIDLTTMRFGAPGKDLTAALYYFCSDTQAEEELKRVYFGHLGSEREEHFHKFEPLYRAWHHLSRWAAKSRAAWKQVKKSGENIQEIRKSRFKERQKVWDWIDRGSG